MQYLHRPDGLSVTKISEKFFGGAVTDRWICPRTDCAYLAVRLVLGSGIGMQVGVTALEPKYDNIAMCIDERSWAYDCYDSSARPSHQQWDVPANKRQRRPGDLIGLLVLDSRLYVFVNNEPLSRRPVAAGLPERVLFWVECYCNDQCFKIEPEARLPDFASLEL